MLEVNDKTEYLPEESELNKAANREIKNIIETTLAKLSDIETSEEEDWLVNLKGNPQALIDRHELDITWESDTDQFDEAIKGFIQDANE